MSIVPMAVPRRLRFFDFSGEASEPLRIHLGRDDKAAINPQA
jgi:hypothetical protein